MATTTTVQIGTYSALTDSFTLGLDINDRITYFADTESLPQAKKETVEVFNIRTVGEQVLAQQHRNRVITITLAINKTGSTVDALLAAATALQQKLEQATPWTLKLQAPNATRARYSTVQYVEHDIDYFVKDVMAQGIGGKKRIHIALKCLPFSFSIPRQWLSNLVTNPGFEVPSGPGVQVFNDTFLNFNAYAVQVGGALAQDTLRYPDVVTADAPLRYFRLDESSGTTTFDAEANGNGTTHGSPTQGVAGLLTGDSDTCYTFASASSQYVGVPTTGLPTGNGAITLEAIIKFAANPSSAALIIGYGAGTLATHNVLQMYLDTSGKLNVDVFSAGLVTSPSALTTGTPHHVACTWDGTTLTLYLDGASVGTPTTPGNQTIPASPNLNIGANSAAAGFFNGQIDEPAIYGKALSSSRITAHYNAFNTTPAVTANTMLIPNGGREAFGSPAWGAINTWQVRFRFIASLTATFYLHFTDINNNLQAVVMGTSLTLNQVVGGTTHQLGTQTTFTLVNGVQYWLQFTQFGTMPGNFQSGPTIPPTLQAQILADNGGAVGTAVAPLLETFNMFDAVTAQTGRPQIAASGAALGIGGNFANVHTVSLFGPGGWLFTGLNAAATGASSGAWDTAAGNPTWSATTYPNGPVNSVGAARIDLAPAGQVDAYFNLYNGGAPFGTQAMPVGAAGNVVGVSCYYKTSAGLGANAVVRLDLRMFDVNGNLLGGGSVIVASATGPQTTWTLLSGNVTTIASTAYLDVRVHVVDTNVGASANQTVWFDNVQCWDQTRTNMATMPWCDLRGSQSPYQMVVSGILGDEPAPVALMLGTSVASLQSPKTLIARVGRRGVVSAAAQLVDWVPSGFYTAVLDPTSYGGSYRTANLGPPTAWNDQRPTQAIAALLGAYRLFQRFWSAQSVGNLPKVSVSNQPSMTQWAAAVGVTIPGPLTVSSQWTMVDAGVFYVPLTPLGGLDDPTGTLVETITTFWQDPVGAAVRSDVLAYLPADVALVQGVFNPANQIYTNLPFWLYWDASSPAGGAPAGVAITQSVLPQPAGAAGGSPPPLINTGGITNASEPAMSVDPTLKTAGGGANGVNQFLAIVNDSVGTILPAWGEIVYSPQYLYPL